MLGDGPGPDGIDPRYLRCHADLGADQGRRPRSPRSCTTARRGASRRTASWSTSTSARTRSSGTPGCPSWRDYYLGLDQRAALRVPAHGAAGAQLPAGPEPVGAQDPAAPRAARPPARRRSPTPPSRSRCATRWRCSSRRSRCSPTATGCAASAIDADELAAYWIDRIERLLRAAVRDAHLIPERQRVDVEFGEFMADDLAMAARILDVAGLELTDPARDALEAYLAGNPRGKDGRVRLRPAGRLRARARRAPRAVRVLLRGVPPDPHGGALMPGIHRERPGADAIAAAHGRRRRSTSATASGCRRACRTATCSRPTTAG